MIEKKDEASIEDSPVSPATLRFEPNRLLIHIHGQHVMQINRRHILMVRDACNDHIKQYGAVDLQENEVMV